MVSALDSGLIGSESFFCVHSQDTSTSQCLSPPRSINGSSCPSVPLFLLHSFPTVMTSVRSSYMSHEPMD